jgi:hypothetical protein
LAVTAKQLSRLALTLPGVEEGTSYGTKAWRVRKKLLARLREDGESLVVKTGDIDEREALLEADPKTYYITEHYRNHPSVLVRLSRVSPAELAELIEEEWRRAAPRRLVAEYDEGRG